MASDFEVFVDCGGGQVLEFRLTEQELLDARDPQIAAAAHGPEGRKSLRTAAYLKVHNMVSKNASEPISIVDGDGVTVIPVHAIRSVRMRDPEIASERRPFGFAMRQPDSGGSE